jgi:hypothetical protein
MMLCCMARCRGGHDLVVFGWLRSLRDGVADLQWPRLPSSSAQPTSFSETYSSAANSKLLPDSAKMPREVGESCCRTVDCGGQAHT